MRMRSRSWKKKRDQTGQSPAGKFILNVPYFSALFFFLNEGNNFKKISGSVNDDKGDDGGR